MPLNRSDLRENRALRDRIEEAVLSGDYGPVHQPTGAVPGAVPAAAVPAVAAPGSSQQGGNTTAPPQLENLTLGADGNIVDFRIVSCAMDGSPDTSYVQFVAIPPDGLQRTPVIRPAHTVFSDARILTVGFYSSPNRGLTPIRFPPTVRHLLCGRRFGFHG